MLCMGRLKDKKLGEEERKITPFTAKPNYTAQCFALVDRWWPKDRAFVAKALQKNPAAEVLAELEIAVQEGYDLREFLSSMVVDYGRRHERQQGN